jgi:integrase
VKRGELQAMPYIVKVKVGTAEPKGRPLEIDELRKLYRAAPPHVQAYLKWGLGTAARPAAIIDLHANQVDWVRGVVNLNPKGRAQNKKHRPEVRLPQSLSTSFEGFLIQIGSQPVKSIKTAWRASVARAGLTWNVSGYSLRHTAARWMRLHGVPIDEVRQQLGHKVEGVTGVYTGYDPRYLERACAALDQPVLATCNPKAQVIFC